MRVKNLLETTSCEVRLHDGGHGLLVAKTRASLEKYSEVEVLRMDCRLDFGVDRQTEKAYLFVYGNPYDIKDCKRAMYEQSGTP